MPGAIASRAGSASGRAPCRRGEAPFDLVLANLIASVLVRLAEPLAAELRPADDPRGGGRLLASGIFVDREDEVREAFAAAGLEVLRADREGEWVALEAVRA